MAHNLGAIGAANLSAGLGAGLQSLTNHKMEEIKLNKLRSSLNALPKEAQDFIMYTAQYNPKGFEKIIPMLQGIPAQGGQQEGPIQGMQGLGQQQAPQSGMEMLGQQQAPESQQPMTPKNIFGQSISKPADQKIGFEDKLGIQASHDLAKDIKNTNKSVRKLGTSAKEALALLEKNKEDLPSFVTRNIPQKYNPFATDSIRTLESFYEDMANDIAALKGKESGFRSGAAILNSVQKGKANISLPYESQKALLKRIIDLEKDSNDQVRSLYKVRSDNNGKYPANLDELLFKGKNNEAVIEQDDNGDIYINGVLHTKK